MGAGKTKALVSSSPLKPPGTFSLRPRGCPEIHASGTVAAVPFREAPLGGVVRLSRQNETARSAADIPRQCGHTRSIAKTIDVKALPLEPPYENRYPFLDRGLLEFLFAIPREQLVRPTQRRSLMRRALLGIVPNEILNRKAKAFVARSPIVALSADWAHLVEMTEQMVSSSLGIVDSECFLDALQSARRGREVSMIRVMRTISIEDWLRTFRPLGILQIGRDLKPGLTLQASIQS